METEAADITFCIKQNGMQMMHQICHKQYKYGKNMHNT